MATNGQVAQIVRGVRPAGTAFVVELGGEIDVYTSPTVKTALADLIDREHDRLVIDLAEVRYIDSTGLGVLIGGLKRVRARGGRLVLVCTSPQITRLLEITGLLTLFPVFADEASALRALD